MILRLAWRSIWRQKRRTLITVVSIGFGLALAVFFIAVAEGAYSQLVEQVVRMQAGHVTIENPAYRDAPAIDLRVDGVGRLRAEIERLDQVESTKLLILGQGVARSGAGAVGVSLMGVEPAGEAKTSPLSRNLVAGQYLAPEDDALVVIGRELAERLKLDLGRKLVLTTNDVSGQLKEELCRVKGVFATGSPEVDGYLVQAPLKFLGRLFGLPPDSATQVGLILKDPADQSRVIKAVRGLTGGRDLAVLPWQEVMPELAAYIRMDRGSNWIMQAILLFLIMFTIFNTILMSVLERSREFAVLLALGTAAGQVRRQIITETIYLGLIGCGAGLLVGGLASGAAQVWGINMSALMPEGVTISGFAVSPVFHAKLTWPILAWSGGLVFGATVLLGLIPTRRAVRVSVVDQLRG